jgi:transposase-like protein
MPWAAATTRTGHQPAPVTAMAIAAAGSPPAEGPIEYGVPQVADRAEPFVSRVRAGLAGRTAELERLAVQMFARGLSTRDIEAAFRDASGASVLSRTAVSQVTERLWQEYEAFAGREHVLAFGPCPAVRVRVESVKRQRL